MYMTYEPCQRCAEGRASEPRPRPAAAVRTIARGGRAVSAGLCDLPAPGLSLPARSAAAETAGADQRSEEGIHRQTLAESDSTSAAVRQRERAFDQRSGQSS